MKKSISNLFKHKQFVSKNILKVNFFFQSRLSRTPCVLAHQFERKNPNGFAVARNFQIFRSEHASRDNYSTKHRPLNFSIFDQNDY